MAKEREFVQTQPDLPKMGNEGHPLLGSGYDQGFKAGQKQASAEVLAACLALMKPQWLHGGVKELQENQSILVLRAEMEKLQPAAEALEEHDRQLQIETYNGARKLWEKDLEELLREERLEEHKAVCPDCNAVVESDWPKPTKFKLAKPCQRRAELEKARAEGKG